MENELTMIFKRDGGTLRLSGIMMEPKFSPVATLKTLNQSMSKTVRSPGNRSNTFSSLYDLNGVILDDETNVSQNFFDD